MKAIVTFDLDQYSNRLFKTKEEWDIYKDGFRKYHQQVWNDPDKFPCVAIETRLEWNDNGADWQHHFFIYDFTLDEANVIDTVIDKLDPDMSRHEIVELREMLIRNRNDETKTNT